MGEFPEKVWIMTPMSSIGYILSIDEEFIENYIEHTINNTLLETMDADIPSMLVS
jgi:hypothetical protein